MNPTRSVWLALYLCTSCSAVNPPVSPTIASQSQIAPLEPRFKLGTESFSTQGLLQKLAEETKRRFPHLPQSKIDWRKLPPRHGFQQRADLSIRDVKLAETGESIMNAASSAAITPDYGGHPVELVLTGTFLSDKKGLSPADFAYALESPLILQSLLNVSSEPRSRVVLDDAILLTTEQASASEIRVSLDTRAIPDLYLKGLHKLTLIHGDFFTDVLIRFGEPVSPVQSLKPGITAIEVVRSDLQVPRYLRVRGQNLMVQGLFAYATIDNEFGFCAQTSVTETEGQLEWETLILVPEPQVFDQRSLHSLVYTTPYGSVLKSF